MQAMEYKLSSGQGKKWCLPESTDLHTGNILSNGSSTISYKQENVLIPHGQ